MATVDVSDPRAMTVISGSDFPQPMSHVVPNGSGLALACGAPFNDNNRKLQLYDARDPQNTSVFLTEIDTPGTAQAIAVFNALAFVADADRGLQVVNYLGYDANGVPPTISFTTNATGGQTQEGAFLVVDVVTDDDVQVRAVDLLIDGQVVQTDGGYPFQFLVSTPLRSVQDQMRVAVLATDAGGNRAQSTEERITITVDLTAPSVVQYSPPNDTRTYDAFTAAIRISETIDLATIGPASVRLEWAGADGMFDTSDDEPLAATISPAFNGRVVAIAGSVLDPIGRLRLTLDSSRIADRAGNLLDGNNDGAPGATLCFLENGSG